MLSLQFMKTTKGERYWPSKPMESGSLGDHYLHSIFKRQALPFRAWKNSSTNMLVVAALADSTRPTPGELVGRLADLSPHSLGGLVVKNVLWLIRLRFVSAGDQSRRVHTRSIGKARLVFQRQRTKMTSYSKKWNHLRRKTRVHEHPPGSGTRVQQQCSAFTFMLQPSQSFYQSDLIGKCWNDFNTALR